MEGTFQFDFTLRSDQTLARNSDLNLPLVSREWKNGSNTADGQNPALPIIRNIP